MEASDKIQFFRGYVEVALYDAKTGERVSKVERHNIIASKGRAWNLLLLQSDNAASSQTLGFLAVGTDTTAAASSDTALGSEVVRVAVGTYDNAGTTATDAPYFRIVATLATDEGNATIGEIGLFNSSAGGTLFGHAVVATQEKTTSQTAGITYTISN